MMGNAQTYAKLERLVAQMSLAVYNGQTGVIDEEDVWAALGDGCSAIADLAEKIAGDREEEA